MSVSGAGGRPEPSFEIIDPWATEPEPEPEPAAPGLTSEHLRGNATLEQLARGETTLGQGSRGDPVLQLQRALVLVGAAISPDGAYGPRTSTAVRALQGRAGLPVTGNVDKATIAALDRELAARAPQPSSGATGAGGADAPGTGPHGPGVDPFDGPTIRPTPARTTTISGGRPIIPGAAPGASGSPAAPARPALPEPSRYDTNWFVDADDLEVPSSVRVYLDRALAGDSASIHALRELDINLASPAEKAQLVQHLLDGNPSGRDQRRIIHLLSRKPAETPAILAVLERKGRLAPLVGELDGNAKKALLKILPRAAAASCDPGLAAAFVGALAHHDTREHRLGAHHVFDAARAGGVLDATLASVRRAHGANPVALELVGQAKPTIRPVIMAHRGLPTEHPENTMPAIRAALAAGANGLEIDVTITADDKLVLWHDYDHTGLIARARNFGLESGMGFRPILPGLGTSARRPVHELDLDTFRRNFGYAPRDAGIGTSQRADVEIPLFEELAQLAKANPDLEEIVVDVKLPPDRPDLHARFARQLDATLTRHGLQNRVTILHNDAGVVRNLKNTMGSRYAFSHDVEIVSLAPSARDYSATRSASALGNTVASIGRPVVGINGYNVYLEALRNDRRAIDRAEAPPRLVTWTINDELELREVMAIGVNGIITDDPALLAKLVKVYGLDK